jgi:hypothetical protein
MWYPKDEKTKKNSLRKLGPPKKMKETELLLKVKRCPQPWPPLQKSKSGVRFSDGGNCYACAYLAAANHFGAKRGYGKKAVQEAMDLFLSENALKEPFADQGYKSLMRAFERTNFEVKPMKERPFIVAPGYFMSMSGLLNNVVAFIRELREHLESGWVAVASVKLNYKRESVHLFGSCDHFLVVDGIREIRRQIYYKGEKLNGAQVFHELHLVDSSTRSPGYSWMDYRDYIQYMGGTAIFFVKPKEQSSEVATTGEES